MSPRTLFNAYKAAQYEFDFERNRSIPVLVLSNYQEKEQLFKSAERMNRLLQLQLVISARFEGISYCPNCRAVENAHKRTCRKFKEE